MEPAVNPLPAKTPTAEMRLSPASAPRQCLKMLALIPHANLPGTSNNYSVSGTYSLDRFSFDEKLTWQIDPKSSMFAKYSYLSADVKSPSTLGIGGGTGLSPGGSNSGSGYSQTRVSIGGLGYTRSLSDKLLFDANFGIGLNDLTWYENDFAPNLGLSLGIPGTNNSGDGNYGPDHNQQGLPSFAVTGLETFGNPDAYTPELKNDFTYTYVANLSWILRQHTLRFGLQMLNNRMREYQPQRGFGPRGGFTFAGGVTSLKGGASSTSANGFAQFLLGLPDSHARVISILIQSPHANGSTGFMVRTSRYPKLTLTYGLRWEYYPMMTRQGRGLNATIWPPTMSFSAESMANLPPPVRAPVERNSRRGLVWPIGSTLIPFSVQDTESVLTLTRSAGRSRPLPGTIAQTVNANNSYVAAGNFVNGIPGYSTVAPLINNGIAQLPLAAYTKTLPPGTFRRGYVESWNGTVEREFPAGFDFTASYVGTQPFGRSSTSKPMPGKHRVLEPLASRFSGVQAKGGNPGDLPFSTPVYNALQLKLRHAFSHGVLLTAAYTYSKSIDQASDDDSVPLFNAVAYLYRNRALSDFNRTHVFDAGFTAGLPFGKGQPFSTSPTSPTRSLVVGGSMALFPSTPGCPSHRPPRPLPSTQRSTPRWRTR